MQISTKLFGEITILQDKIINFEMGIPGFPEETDFILIHDEENESSPFCFLQSVNNTDLAFTLIDILSIIPSYKPIISKEEMLSIGESEKDGFYVYCIVNITSNIEELTANLKAPIIINAKTNVGRQAIADNKEFDIKHNIYNEIMKGEQP